jgi:hypothetical protein
MYNLSFTTGVPVQSVIMLDGIQLSSLKDVKELVYWGFGRIKKEVWAKAEDHVLKIEKEYCIDRGEIPPIIIDFDDDESVTFIQRLT